MINFCSSCAAEMLSKIVCGSEQRVCSQCERVHFLDPKVAAGCLIYDQQDRVLLVQRSITPVGLWTFPGGFVDRFEDPDVAAMREVREETGVELKMGPLVDIYRVPTSPVLLIIYLARLAPESPPAQALHECQEVGYFSAEEVPWERLAYANTPKVLKDGFRLVSEGRI